MKNYQRYFSPDANAGNTAWSGEENEAESGQKTDSSKEAEAKKAPTETNKMINNTGLDHPPANNDEDTDLSEGTHDADAATG
jgi:hypothetical protein